MAKSNSKRKTYSDKFSLTLHKTGQYCKKIKGKIYYFGIDRKEALSRYLEHAACHDRKYSPPCKGRCSPVRVLRIGTF